MTAEPPRAPTPGPDRPARTYGREELPDDDEPDDFSGGEEVGQEAAKHGAGDGGGRQQGRQEPALRPRRGRGPASPPAVPQPGPGMPTRWLSFTRTSPLTQTPRRWNWPPRLEWKKACVYFSLKERRTNILSENRNRLGAGDGAERKAFHSTSSYGF